MASQSGLRVLGRRVLPAAPADPRRSVSAAPPGALDRAHAPIAPLAHALVVAAAAAGVAEIALARVAAPITSHVPAAGAAAEVAAAVRAGGDAAVGATLLLVVAAAAALARDRIAAHVAVGAALVAALVGTLASTAASGPLPAVVSYAALGTVSVFAPIGAMRRRGTLYGAGVAALGAGFVAGLLPIVVDAVTGRAAPGGMFFGSVAELAVLAALALFAAHAVRRGVARRSSWWAAGIGSVAAAGLLAVDPANAAAVSLWATGVTLGLPPIAYVLGAGCLGLVAVEWLATPGARHLAAGLALVAVAGIGPALVHHNLTAIVGLAVLATPATAPDVCVDPDRGPTGPPRARSGS